MKTHRPQKQAIALKWEAQVEPALCLPSAQQSCRMVLALVRSEDEEEAAEGHIPNTEDDLVLVGRSASTSHGQQGWQNSEEVADVPGPTVSQMGGEYCMQSRRQGTGQSCPCHQPDAHSLMHDGPIAQRVADSQAVAIGHESAEEALVSAQQLGGVQLGHAAVEGDGYVPWPEEAHRHLWKEDAGEERLKLLAFSHSEHGHSAAWATFPCYSCPCPLAMVPSLCDGGERKVEW